MSSVVAMVSIEIKGYYGDDDDDDVKYFDYVHDKRGKILCSKNRSTYNNASECREPIYLCDARHFCDSMSRSQQ